MNLGTHKKGLSPYPGMEKETRQLLQALAYPIWLLALICIVAIDDKDKTLRYHLKQGFVFSLLLCVVIWVLQMVLGWMLFWIFPLLWLAYIVLAILYAIRAYKNEMFKVPVAYDIMKRIWKD
jgi:uncharacterized membrane protein